MYPASFYVMMASASSGITAQQFYGKITDTSDSDYLESNEMIHAILKAGNKTSTTLLNKTVT